MQEVNGLFNGWWYRLPLTRRWQAVWPRPTAHLVRF